MLDELTKAACEAAELRLALYNSPRQVDAGIMLQQLLGRESLDINGLQRNPHLLLEVSA